MFSRNLICLILIFLIPVSVQALGNVQSDSEMWMNRVHFWSLLDEDDLAIETLQDMLRAEPDNADALASMTLFQARRGNTNDAIIFLSRLKVINPAHPEIEQLEATIERGREFSGKLSVIQPETKSVQDQIWDKYYRQENKLSEPQYLAQNDYVSALLEEQFAKRSVPNPQLSTQESPVRSTSTKLSSPQSAYAIEVPEQIVVKRGDTLSNIAARIKPDGISLQRMLVALYHVNRNHFADGNMSRLKAGSTLNVPSAEDVVSFTRSEKEQRIYALTGDWNNYRQTLAGVSTANLKTDAAPRTDQGDMAFRAIDETPAVEQPVREILRLSKGNEPGDKVEADAATEEEIAKNKALAEESARIALLERDLKDLQRLAQLKSDVSMPPDMAVADVAKVPQVPRLSDKLPARDSLLERAKYWEHHGRSDLAARARNQFEPAQQDKSGERGLTDMSMHGDPAASGMTDSNLLGLPEESNGKLMLGRVVPSNQKLEERAKYWEAQGRPDLADKVRRLIKPSLQVTQVTHEPSIAERLSKIQLTIKNPLPPDTESQRELLYSGNERDVIRPRVAEIKPSSQQRESRAQYWASRGRADLADKASDQFETVQVDSGSGRIEQTRVLSRPLTLKPVAPAVTQPQYAEVDNQPRLPDAESTLQQRESKARYWQSRGRDDLATKADEREEGAGAVRGRDDTPVTHETYARPMQSGSPQISTRESGRLAVPVRSTLSNSRTSVFETRVRDSRDAAQSSLEDRLLIKPDSLQARLDLALIYRNAGEMAKARDQIDSVLALRPDLPEALLSSAKLYAEQHLWREALYTLDRISPAARTAEMGMLQKMTWAHVQIERADELVRLGENAEAELLLRQVATELEVHNNPEMQIEPPGLWKNTSRGKKKN